MASSKGSVVVGSTVTVLLFVLAAEDTEGDAGSVDADSSRTGVEGSGLSRV